MVSEEGFNVGHYDSKKYTPRNDRSEYQANHDSFSTKHLLHHLLNDVWRLRWRCGLKHLIKFVA
jgi:hypothetical protein